MKSPTLPLSSHTELHSCFPGDLLVTYGFVRVQRYVVWVGQRASACHKLQTNYGTNGYVHQDNSICGKIRIKLYVPIYCMWILMCSVMHITGEHVAGFLLQTCQCKNIQRDASQSSNFIHHHADVHQSIFPWVWNPTMAGYRGSSMGIGLLI